MGMQYFHKVITGILIENEHTLTVALRLFLLIGKLFLNDFYIVLPGKILQCFVIGELFVFHHEVDGRPSFPARETFTDILRGRDIKRGCPVVMKRAQSHKIHTPTTKRHKVGDNLCNLR